MPITCLAVGDPHFQVKNVPDAEELIKKLQKLVQSLKPTFVVLLGDLLHTHEKIHVVPFNLATTLITSLAEMTPVYLIIGNHDLINHEQFLTENHAFNSFKEVHNVTVCDNVIVREIGDKKFVFCPYVPPERFEEALDTCGEKWSDATCIFAHQEFYGCRFNPVMTSTEGDIWPEEYPFVVSGHIHDEQWLQSNIYYTGSSMQHAFGESPKKTVALITFDKCKKIQKIDLELRKKKIVYMDIEKAAKYTPPTDTLVKLQLKGTAEEFKVFRRSPAFKQLQKTGVKIGYTPIISEAVEHKPAEKKGVLQILEELIENDGEEVKRAFNELKKSIET